MSDASPLCRHFDAVVMFTFSDWKTEPRSNRYHFATRFARRLPVIFIQPDRLRRDHRWEDSGLPNLRILHVPRVDLGGDGDKSLTHLALYRALSSANIERPLFWAYSFHFARAVATLPAPLKIYHATEDYTSRDYFTLEGPDWQSFQSILSACHGVVAVSEGVRRNHDAHLQGTRPTFLSANGCDFHFFDRACAQPRDRQSKIAFYQGGINYRLDFDLLLAIARELPDWEFHPAGNVVFREQDGDLRDTWKRMLGLPNVRHLGALAPEPLRDAMCRATVGVIPFRVSPYIRHSSPLKAYEYVACGLPVVTVPIDALASKPELFATAREGAPFIQAIRESALTWDDPALRALRRDEAKANGYDSRFEAVSQFLLECVARQPKFQVGALKWALAEAEKAELAKRAFSLKKFIYHQAHQRYHQVPGPVKWVLRPPLRLAQAGLRWLRGKFDKT